MSEEFWIYFEKNTGMIKKISGKKENTSDLLSIPVLYEQVKDIYEGRKNFNNFVVEYSIRQKEYKFCAVEDRVIKTAHFLEIPNNLKNYEILIIQNIKNKCWEIKISRDLKKELKKENIYSKSQISFSITQKGNPHVLYRFIKVDLHSLVNNLVESIPFTNLYEEKEVSVFTSKYFNAYSHKVKK